MAANDLYRHSFWPKDDDAWTDDWTSREALTPITNATINGQWGEIENVWRNSYGAISRANNILVNIQEKESIPQAKLDRFAAEARFVRASKYADLISHFGDVIYYENILDLDEAFTLGKTDKNEILQNIYEDYDFAIGHLPETYGDSELKRATKGAALAMKARIALYMSDWEVARDAAKATMDLGVYELYPDYGGLFRPENKNTDEIIFSIPRSKELGVTLGSSFPVRATVTRNPGGWASYNPSWDLFSVYLCTDGQPIDESSLYDPRNPFENRDPRCTETIVEFQTPHLGFMYQPHPDSTEVLNFTTGEYQTNNDTRSVVRWASFNGLVWKKDVTEDWADDLLTDPEEIIIRFADVLLMYAEAKIELNEIDQSVLDAINKVRARAYGVDLNTSLYPKITTTSQDDLRKELRIERRMEFAKEGLRYMDLIRWKLAEKALNRDVYGMLDVEELKEKVVDQGLWFFPGVPEIDEDGIADFSAIYNAGLIKKLADREFDASKQYLWPLPTKEIQINNNLTQNPNY